MTGRPITIVLLGEPVAFARMRVNGTHHFMPKKQRNTAAALRIEAQRAMLDQGGGVLDGPLAIEMHAEFAIPGSWSKRKRAAAIAGELRPAKRPDIDNIAKLVGDALNTVVYRDDAQIVDARARKVYGVEPKLVVTVRPI